MRKKLALLLFRYFPYGGLQKDFLGIAKELIARDHELRCIQEPGKELFLQI